MNPAKHLKVGKEGEMEASAYLTTLGYKIIGKNIRCKFGEIDIAAISRKGTLVFVEVKTLRSGGDLVPEDNMSSSKIEKLKKTCSFVANSNPDLCEKKGWQIDLLALTKKDKNYEIKHYSNIVSC